MKTYNIEDFFLKKSGKITLSLDWDFIEKIPEFARLKECEQSTVWHREGNVFTHTKLVAEEMIAIMEKMSIEPEFTIQYAKTMVIAALFHDIGKGVTTFQGKDGKWHSYGHEDKGEAITRRLLWDNGIRTRETICMLVKYHMEPLHIFEKKDYIERILFLNKNIMQFTKYNVYDVPFSNERCINFTDLCILKYCDIIGSHQANENSKQADLMTLELLKTIFKDIRKDGLYVEDITSSLRKIVRIRNLDSVTKPKKTCFIMMGLPGAGKDHAITNIIISKPELETADYFGEIGKYGKAYCEKLLGLEKDLSFNSICCISRDGIREELGHCGHLEKHIGTEEEEAIVTKKFEEKILEGAKSCDVIVINNMNNKRSYRDGYKKLLSNYDVTWVYSYIEAKVIEDNIERRKDYISSDAFEKIIEKFEMPTVDEYDVLTLNLTWVIKN